MTRNTFVFAILLVLALASGWTGGAGDARAFCLCVGLSTRDRDLPARHGGRHARAGRQGDERRTGAVVPGVRSGGEISVRRERDRPGTRAVVCDQPGDRCADADKRCAVMGSITAHLSTDSTGRWLLVANYGGEAKQGTIASIPIGADGRLGAAVDTREFGLGSMAHQIRADPGNRFVYVPLKGGPAVAQLVFDPATGRMKPNVPPQVAAAAGAGPRHLDFHPNGRFAYVINELDLTMTAYAYDAKTGIAARAADSSDAAGRSRQGGRLVRRRPRASHRPVSLRLEPRSRQHRHLSPRRGRAHDARRPRVARHQTSPQFHDRSDGHADARGQSGCRERDDLPHRSEQRARSSPSAHRRRSERIHHSSES